MTVVNASALPYRTVALTGGPASGVSRASFTYLSVPSINNAGQTAFFAIFDQPSTGSGSGLFSEGSGFLQPRVLRHEPAPGIDGATFWAFGRPTINDQGHIVWFAVLEGEQVPPSPNNSGLWVEESGGIAAVALDSQPVLQGDGGTFVSYSTDLFLTANQTVVAYARLENTPNDAAIVQYRDGQLTKIVQQGDGVPGDTSGQYFRQLLDTRTFEANNAGEVVFAARVSGGSPVNGTSDTGLWRYADDALSAALVPGLPVPGQAGQVFTNVGLSFSLNHAGQVAVRAATGSASTPWLSSASGLWLVGADNQPELVMSRGDAAPGLDGLTLGSPNNIELNGAGRVLFTSRLSGPGVSDDNELSLWAEEDAGLRLIARQGDAAPGTDTVFDSFLASGLALDGSVFFRATLTGAGVTDDNNDGLWLAAPGAAPVLVAREGDPFDVDDDPLTEVWKTVSAIDTESYAGDYQAGRAMNDTGQLAFLLEFTDGGHGVFVAEAAVPEPVAGALALIAVCLNGPRRRQGVRRGYGWN